MEENEYEKTYWTIAGGVASFSTGIHKQYSTLIPILIMYQNGLIY